MSSDTHVTSQAIQTVKNALKKWEWEFRAANGGRKPGREDIKNNARISAQYEEYDRLTGRGSRRSSPQTRQPKASTGEGDERVLQGRSANSVAATPKKGSKFTETIGDIPTQADEPTPACVRFALGPTPQKDGAVLSLFDSFPTPTPSKSVDTLTASMAATVNATPSKSSALQSSEQKLAKTPQSSAKRYYLEVFGGTPLKRKRDDEDVFTPSTVKKQFATPAFLRRNRSLAVIDEEDRDGSAQPFKKRGLVRSLSAIIQGLKKQEEERLEDEWDVLNEIEAEQGGKGETRPKGDKVLVEDSQAVEMPLGPDQGVESDEEGGDRNALDADGRPRKVWKKKGLKRQTRRSTMRPVLHKAQKAVKDGDGEDNESDDTAANGEASGDEPHDDATKNRSKTTTKPSAEDGKTDKKPRKVSAQAHANFRKLKIKNKNSKATGRGGRFGRR